MRHLNGVYTQRFNRVHARVGHMYRNRSDRERAIVGASMRKLVQFIYGVIKSGIYFDMGIPMRTLAFQDGI